MPELEIQQPNLYTFTFQYQLKKICCLIKMVIHIRDCSYLWVYRHKSFCNTQFDISPIMLVQPQLQSGNGE